jgi:hypothetical protein
MSFRFIARWTATMGAIAAFLVFVLVGVAVTTGVSQEYFEGLHPAAEYSERIAAAASALRLDFAFDNLFILAYGSFFIGLAIVLRRFADHSLVNLALAAMLGTAFLDMVENHHIMAMADSAVMGMPISDGEIRLQTVISLIKFHFSCFGALLFALAIPRTSAVARWAIGLALAYACFGVLILTAPTHWLDLLALIRTLFFVLTFVVISIFVWSLPEPDKQSEHAEKAG